MDFDVKLSNAFKIFYLTHPTYLGKPSVKELKREGLLDKVDFNEEDTEECSELETLYSSEEEVDFFVNNH